MKRRDWMAATGLAALAVGASGCSTEPAHAGGEEGV
jgi:hypothetical protein